MRSLRILSAVACLSVLSLVANTAHADDPAPQPVPFQLPNFPQIPGLPPLVQPADPNQQPQPQYPQQQPQYPQQQPQYPQQQPQYPQQQPQYPQQQPQYPQQQPQYPQPQMQPQQPMFAGQPPAPPAAVQPTNPRNAKRGIGELGFLYGAMATYGVGTGIWIDALAKAKDPAVVILPPLLIGVGAIVGTYFWDANTTLHRGVPSATALGISLGIGEGLAIVGTQSQLSSTNNGMTLGAASTVTWLTATGGGIGGYLFGEFLRPDPRGVALIAMGSTLGTTTGLLMGMGSTGGHTQVMDGGSIGVLLGLNAGMVGTAILSTVYTPSWASQKYMWMGYGIGALASAPLYALYAFSDDPQPKPMLAVTGLAGLAGATLAAVFTSELKDDVDGNVTRAEGWKPPFQLGFSPSKGGGLLTAFGQF